jgi:hypothetical protein
MNLLRLEELESRDLLNAAYVAPQPLSRESMPGNPPMWLAAPPFAGDFGGPGAGGGRMGQALGGMPQSFDTGSAPEITFIIITFDVPEQASAGNTGGTYVGSNAGVTVSNPKPPAPDAGSIAAVADLSSLHAAATASRAGSQAPFVLVNPAVVPALSGELQGQIAAPLSARTVRPGVEIVPPGPAWLTQGPTATAAATPAVEDSQPAEAKSVESALPGVLAALPTIDMAALGHGLQQFLTRIERAGEELVGDGDGLRPWIVAGAAAATACEIARRQMAKSHRSAFSDQRSARPIWLTADR